MPPIPPDDWRRLAPLFDTLLELAPADREPWLRDRSALADADREQLRDLLRAHEEAGDSLETPLPQAAAGLVAASMTDPLLGQTLGPYRVESEIGRGGMGVVYLGTRTTGEFQQDVVIKVLRLGIDSDEMRRRFLQERQILADLDHPAIVRLLDGGFTPDGRPYLVMNRIDGEPIDAYCDRAQLDVTARVRLCLGVIEAVDHAHRHLVIHRDIKPGNVWVDREGKVHLLDFGIAKMADQDAHAALTAVHDRLLTPEYASPEQINRLPVTTASDVYQLGVLVYQVVTGCYPYVVAGGTTRDVERTILETEPVPASRALTTRSRTVAGTAAHDLSVDEIVTRRRTSAGGLRRTLKGDLEVVLQKALRKEPGRRYLSARELRGDLIRWLSGDRVLARRDSVPYRVRRFVRRHTLAAVLLATLLVGAGAFGTFHVQRIRAERDIARVEAERRKEVSDFLVELLKVPDPTLAEGREITARELLEVSIPRIDEDLSDPETRLRLLAVVGEVARNLGLYDQAGPALARRVVLTREMHGTVSREAADALGDVADLWRLARMHRDALGPAEEALAIRRELLPAGHVDIGRSLMLVALLHRDLDEVELAEAELREATAILEAALPPDDRLRVVIRADLAYVLRTAGKVDEAEAIYREILPAMRRNPADHAGSLPGVMNNLAYLLRGKEQYAEAETLYREAIARNEEHYGEAHPSTLMFRNNLASVLQHQGKIEQTGQELQNIIDLQEHLNGPDHWRTGSAYRSLGYFRFMTGDVAGAAAPLRQGYAILATALGDDHVWTAGAGMTLAACLHALGQDAEAAELRATCTPLLADGRAAADGTVRHWLQSMAEAMTQATGASADDAWPALLRDLAGG